MAIRIVPHRFTVDFEELKGSPTESLSRDFWKGTGAVRVFRCASADRIKLANELLGYMAGFVYHLPHPYTDISRLLVATNIATNPVGKISGQDDAKFANYPKTDLTVTYTIPQETFEAFGGLVTVTETIQEASEFVTLPTKGLFWYVDGVANEPIREFDAPGKVNKLLEWTYEIRNAQFVPGIIWYNYGKVNAYSIYSRSLDTTFPAETLLCGSPTVVRETTYYSTGYNITLRFLIKNNGTFANPFGWNHYPRISDETSVDIEYERMVKAVDAPNTIAGWKVFYQLSDFRTMFVP